MPSILLLVVFVLNSWWGHPLLGNISLFPHSPTYLWGLQLYAFTWLHRGNSKGPTCLKPWRASACQSKPYWPRQINDLTWYKQLSMMFLLQPQSWVPSSSLKLLLCSLQITPSPSQSAQKSSGWASETGSSGSFLSPLESKGAICACENTHTSKVGTQHHSGNNRSSLE